MDSPDLEAERERDWQANLLGTALDRLKQRVSLKQFQMFDLYVTQQWPMEAVTGTLGVSRAQVYMAKLGGGRLLDAEQRPATGPGR